MRDLVPIVTAAAVLGLASTSGALAQERCRVTDPTGTPLNVRSAPNGLVTGQLRNGQIVRLAETARDERGRAWAFVHDRAGDPIGWVFREFVSCF
jgi:ribosomal protein S28E/S33